MSALILRRPIVHGYVVFFSLLQYNLRFLSSGSTERNANCVITIFTDIWCFISLRNTLEFVLCCGYNRRTFYNLKLCDGPSRFCTYAFTLQPREHIIPKSTRAYRGIRAQFSTYILGLVLFFNVHPVTETLR